MNRHLIIIARDRPDLLGPLAVRYGRKDTVDLVFDRRRGQPSAGRRARPDRRHQPHRERLLHEHGFLVLRGESSSPQPTVALERSGNHGRARACAT